jgi:hypothetical protein
MVGMAGHCELRVLFMRNESVWNPWPKTQEKWIIHKDLYWLDEVICRKQFEVDGDSF